MKLIAWDIAGATNNLGSKASTTGCKEHEHPKKVSESKGNSSCRSYGNHPTQIVETK